MRDGRAGAVACPTGSLGASTPPWVASAAFSTRGRSAAGRSTSGRAAGRRSALSRATSPRSASRIACAPSRAADRRPELPPAGGWPVVAREGSGADGGRVVAKLVVDALLQAGAHVAAVLRVLVVDWRRLGAVRHATLALLDYMRRLVGHQPGVVRALAAPDEDVVADRDGTRGQQRGEAGRGWVVVDADAGEPLARGRLRAGPDRRRERPTAAAAVRRRVTGDRAHRALAGGPRLLLGGRGRQQRLRGVVADPSHGLQRGGGRPVQRDRRWRRREPGRRGRRPGPRRGAHRKTCSSIRTY